MAAAGEGPLEETAGARDVLATLRTATAAEHDLVERALDLLDPGLTRERLTAVLTLLHGFWRAAEGGLDAWARAEPADVAALRWGRRRRAHLFAADLTALGADPAGSPVPDLAPVRGTDEALGRLYVLEGSTLGGTFIDRHLATLPALGPATIRAFSPYGPDTRAMWHAYRRAARDRVRAGGDADRMVAAAQGTFGALAAWCAMEPAGSRPTPAAARPDR
jgi:heme oxygenase (biliverdin-IX-beta and delta-forming)